jgi:GNAT superfamily N-acetyltransferase
MAGADPEALTSSSERRLNGMNAADDKRGLLLSALSPDIRFELLPKTEEASDAAFEVKRAALGPHIRTQWGWDEGFQRSFHEKKFQECWLSSITVRDVPVGTIALMMVEDSIQLDEFYLLPSYQGRGLGTRVLRHALSLADELNRPVRLRYLKWNPVGSLYRRHGFVEVGQTDIHFLMRRPVAGLQET